MTNTAAVVLPEAPHFDAPSLMFREHAQVCAEWISAARAGTRVVSEGTPELIVADRRWAPNAYRSMACEAALGTGNVDRFLELIGVPESVQLSSDGRAFDRSSFCKCVEVSAAEWVYVEVWGPQGRFSHGFVHSTCRAWTQTG